MKNPGSSLVLASLAVTAWAGAAHAQEATDLQVHGFISQGFLVSTDNNFLGHSERGSFELFEMGFNVSKELRSDLRAGMQIFAQDLGPIGNYEPVLDWALIDWRFHENVGLRVGRMKLPLGIFNENWDVDISRTPTLLPQSLYDARYRDVLNAVNGLSLYGDLDLGGGGALDWTAYGGTMHAPSHLGDYDVERVFGGRVFWNTPVPGLRLGVHTLLAQFQVHMLLGPGMPLVADYDAWWHLGGSLELVTGPFTFTAEYRSWYSDVKYDPAVLPADKARTEGGYLMGEAQVGERLHLSAYYSVNWDDLDQRSNPDTFHKDAALGVRFDITPEWTVKAEGHYVDGTASVEAALNPEGETRRWGLFLAKTSLAF